MSFHDKWRSLVDNVTGRGVHQAVERMAEMHGEILLGMERRLDGFERRILDVDRRLDEVGLAERVEGLSALARRVRRLEICVVVLALVCIGLVVVRWSVP